MSEIIGHEAIFDFLDTACKNGKLSHAYCFVGRAHVGRRAMAEHIAQYLLDIGDKSLKTQPDFTVVTQLKDEKTEKTKKDITVEQMQNLRSFLSQKPFLGKAKVALIDAAGRMNIHAANALLKTLEEPKPSTTLFLLVEDESDLPQTIQSRCQIIYFHPVQIEKIKIALQNRKATTEQATDMADASRGFPGLAFIWNEDADIWAEYQKDAQLFDKLIGKPLYEKFALVESFFGDKIDHIATRRGWQQMLDLWRLSLHDMLISNGTSILKSTDIVRIDSRIVEAKYRLGQNIHPRLLIERIFLSFPTYA